MIDENNLLSGLLPLLNQYGDMYIAGRIIGLINSQTKLARWIPCSKYLPEVPKGTEYDFCPEFNVTVEGATESTTLKCAPDGTWFDDYGNIYNVITWQLLPEAYQPYRKGDAG